MRCWHALLHAYKYSSVCLFLFMLIQVFPFNTAIQLEYFCGDTKNLSIPA